MTASKAMGWSRSRRARSSHIRRAFSLASSSVPASTMPNGVAFSRLFSTQTFMNGMVVFFFCANSSLRVHLSFTSPGHNVGRHITSGRRTARVGRGDGVGEEGQV